MCTVPDMHTLLGNESAITVPVDVLWTVSGASIQRTALGEKAVTQITLASGVTAVGNIMVKVRELAVAALVTKGSMLYLFNCAEKNKTAIDYTLFAVHFRGTGVRMQPI
jgi:hypothetical protein